MNELFRKQWEWYGRVEISCLIHCFRYGSFLYLFVIHLGSNWAWIIEYQDYWKQSDNFLFRQQTPKYHCLFIAWGFTKSQDSKPRYLRYETVLSFFGAIKPDFIGRLSIFMARLYHLYSFLYFSTFNKTERKLGCFTYALYFWQFFSAPS